MQLRIAPLVLAVSLSVSAQAEHATTDENRSGAPRRAVAEKDEGRAARLKRLRRPLKFPECRIVRTQDQMLSCLKKLGPNASPIELMKALQDSGSGCADITNTMCRSGGAQPTSDTNPRFVVRCLVPSLNSWLAFTLKGKGIEFLGCNATNGAIGGCGDFGGKGTFTGAAYELDHLPKDAKTAVDDAKTGAHGSPRCTECHGSENNDPLKIKLRRPKEKNECDKLTDPVLMKTDCARSDLDDMQMLFCSLSGGFEEKAK